MGSYCIANGRSHVYNETFTCSLNHVPKLSETISDVNLLSELCFDPLLGLIAFLVSHQLFKNTGVLKKIKEQIQSNF